MMKLAQKLKTWGCLLMASLTLVACSGTSADEGEATLTLQASKSSIDADGRDAVTFTVTRSGVDVTKEAEVRCVTTGEVVAESGFTATEAKTYTFEATCEDLVSQQVTVTANEIKQSEFVRKVCLMEWTATSCTFCPEGYRKIEFVLADYPDQLYLLSMHPVDYNGEPDPMGIPQTKELEQKFKIQGYPHTVIDMREVAEAKAANVREAVNRSFTEYPAHCGVAVSSVYNAESKEAQVTVKLHSEKDAEYRVALYVVEDKIVLPQFDNGLWRDDYVHHKVARRLVSEMTEGDKMGKVAAGEEVEKTWTVQLDPAWKLENLSFYALALGEDGTVNNMNACAAENGDSGYARVE